MSRHMPLSAVVGQAQTLLALTLVAIDPSIGGLLIRGPRGTAKSTMARGLAQWLPDAPFVNLPLGADEDKLVGSLDLGAALGQQQVRHQSGLLGRADGGILYVDEVNLLADHLVDLTLDAAASGVNRIEREGVSHHEAARFVLIGTMNPDEGELRAQLLDRFGLCVDLHSPNVAAERAQVLRHRRAFQADEAAFIARFDSAEETARARLARARAGLHDIDDEWALDQVAARCATLAVDGLRGDLAWLAAARAHAAWRAAECVAQEDLDATFALALAHRISAPPTPPPPAPPPPSRRPDSAQKNQSGGAQVDSQAQALNAPTPPPSLGQGTAGRDKARAATKGAARRHPQTGQIAWAASFARSATQGLQRPNNVAQLRRKNPIERQEPAWIFVLDCSASMLRHGVLAKAQGLIVSLLKRAYQTRREVAVLRFAGEEVTVLHPLGRAPKQALDFIRIVPGGGATPLTEGLRCANRLVAQAARRHCDAHIWLLSDGRVGMEDLPQPTAPLTIVDTDTARSGCASRLAKHLDATYFSLQHMLESESALRLRA